MTHPQLLSVENIGMKFGGITALEDVTFTIERGQVCGLIGPNGAGKTTLFNCLSRLFLPVSGRIVFDGVDLAQLPPHKIAALGIGRTFQNLAMFKTMSVLENVMVGVHCRLKSGFLVSSLRTLGVRREEYATRKKAIELLRFLDLDKVAHIRVSELPFGSQKRVELARALASDPKLLLLDEPAAGLNHEEVSALGGVIRDICDKMDITILLVEHHMALVMGVSDKVVALNFGRKISEGTPVEVQNNTEVIRAYLGDSV